MTTDPVVDDGLPPEIVDELTAMAMLDEDGLWQAAEAKLPADDAERLEVLHWAADSRPLSVSERDEERVLLVAYEVAMLQRAQAMMLLKDRGHDITSLLRMG